MTGAGYPNLTKRDLAQQIAPDYSIQQQQQQHAANTTYGRYGLQQQQSTQQPQQQQWGAYNASQQHGRPAPSDSQQAYTVNGLATQNLARKAEMAANTLIGAGRSGGNALLGTKLDPANLGEYSRATTSSSEVSAPAYAAAASQNYGQQQQQSYFPNVSSSSAQSQQATAPASAHQQPYSHANAGYYQASSPQTTSRPAIQDQQRAQQQAQHHPAISNPVQVPTPTQSHAVPPSSAHPYSQGATTAVGVQKQTPGTYGQAQQSPSMVATKIHSAHTGQTQTQKRSPALQSTQWGQQQQQQVHPAEYSVNQGGNVREQQGHYAQQQVHQQQHHLPAQNQQYGWNSPDLQAQQQRARQCHEMRARQNQAQHAQTESPQQQSQPQQSVQHAQAQPIRQVEIPPRQQNSQQYGQPQTIQNFAQQQTAGPVASGRPLNQSQAASAQVWSSASPATGRARPSSVASQRSTTSSRSGKSKPPPRLYLPQAPPPVQPEKEQVNNQKQTGVAEIVSHAVRQKVEAGQQNRAQALTGGAETTTLRDTRQDAQSSGIPAEQHNVKHHQTQSLPQHHNTVQQQSQQQQHPQHSTRSSSYPHTNYLPLVHIHSQPPEPRQPEPPQQYIHPQYLCNRPLTPPSRNLPEYPSPATPAVEETTPVVEPSPRKQRDPEPAAPALPKSPRGSSSAVMPIGPAVEQQSAPPKMGEPEEVAPPVTPSAPQQNQPATIAIMSGSPTLDPAAPLDPSQMEAHMRTMVETMRFYQSRDPNTFHSIWESVRKDSAMKLAIMPAGEPSQTSPTPNARSSTDNPAPAPAFARQDVNTAEHDNVRPPEPAPEPDASFTEDTMEVDQNFPAVETPLPQKRRRGRLSNSGSQPRKSGVENPPTPAAQVKSQSPAPEPQVVEPPYLTVESPVEPSQPAPQPSVSVPPPPYVTASEAKKKEENEVIMRAARTYFLQNFCVEIDMNDLRSVLETTANFPAMCAHFEQKGFRFDRGLFAKYLQANLTNKPSPTELRNQQNGSSEAVAATVVNNRVIQQTASNSGQVEVPNPGRVLGELVGPRQRPTQAWRPQPLTQSTAPTMARRAVESPLYAYPQPQMTKQSPPRPLPHEAPRQGGLSVAPHVFQQPQGPFGGVPMGQPMGYQNNQHQHQQQQFAQHRHLTSNGTLLSGQNPLSQPQQGLCGFNEPYSTVVHGSAGPQRLPHTHTPTPTIQNFTTHPQFSRQPTNHVPIHMQSPNFNSVMFGAAPQQYVQSGMPQSSGIHPAQIFPTPTNIVDLTRDPSPPKLIQRPPLLNLSRRKQEKLDPTVPLALPLKREQALRKNKYKKASICRNILRIIGRHPTEPALNEHLLPLKDNLHLDLKTDLETVRWDLLDPEQPGSVNQEMDVGMEADNDEDGGRALDAPQTPAPRKRKSKKAAAPGSLTSRVQQQGSHLDTSDASTPTIANGNGDNLDDTDSDIEITGSTSKMSLAKRARLTGPDGDGRYFKKYPCKWRSCPAELHNFDAFQLHIEKVHRGKETASGSGIFPCLWENCAEPAMKFKSLEKWDAHIKTHTDQVLQLFGLGPRVAPSDVDSAGSDVDYLSDSRGIQITPIARPAPEGHVFVPPPGHKANKLFKQVHNMTPAAAAALKKRQTPAYKAAYAQAKLLGSGAQRYDFTPTYDGLDDGLGLDMPVIRIINIQQQSRPRQ